MEACLWCSAEFGDAVQLLHHIREAHAPPALASSRKTTPPPPPPPPSASVSSSSTGEVKAISASVKCDLCERTYVHKRSLNRHMRESHVEDSSVEYELKCKVCGKMFKSVRTLRLHLLRVHIRDKKCFTCSVCNGSFRRKYALQIHLARERCGTRRSKVKQGYVKCRKCKLFFPNVIALLRHKVKVHPHKNKFLCAHCGRKFGSRSTLILHRRSLCKSMKSFRERNCKYREKIGGRVKKGVEVERESREGVLDGEEEGEEVDGEREGMESVLEGDGCVHSLKVRHEYDLQMTLMEAKDDIQIIVEKDLRRLNKIKWFAVARVRLQINDQEVLKDSNVKYMRCLPIETLRQDQIEEQVEDAVMGVINNYDKTMDSGSQVLFERVETLQVRTAVFQAIRASSYIPLPHHLDHPRKGLLNIRNFADDKCFLWCILAAICRPPREADYVQKYQHREGELNMQGISYPVEVKDIDIFERNNPEISVSVLALENNRDPVPMRIVKEKKEIHVHLLMIRDWDDEGELCGEGGEEEDDDIEWHYVLITDLSAFLAEHTTRNKRLYWCERCLSPLDSVAKYENHYERCKQMTPQVVRMPLENQKFLKFTETYKQTYHDYVIYYDFECLLKALKRSGHDPRMTGTTQVNEHIPSGFCYVIIGPNGLPTKRPVLFHGEDDVAKKFLTCLREEEVEIMRLRGPKYPIDMTAEAVELFERARNCYLCGLVIPREGVNKVRDHDHKVEKNNYLGAACSAPCNLNRQNREYIPVFGHGCSNYDLHILITALGQVMSENCKVSVIPRTKEKYVAFEWNKLRFLDSVNFLPSSLQKLVDELRFEDLRTLAVEFPDEKQRRLVARKGVYPYEYFDDFSKFEEKELPPIDCFSSKLTVSDISGEDYDHAKLVYKEFGMSNLWSYHDLYLKTDVILLCDIMENYRREALESYKLDPVHFYTSPGFSWAAAMLHTGQELELLTDINKHLMIEAGIRGGVSSINKRKSVCNTPLVPDLYTETEKKKHIVYLDANALYSAALSCSMPTGNFRYLSEEEISKIDVMTLEHEDSTGYILEVDLDYPIELHDDHNDYPLAPEHMIPAYEDLSPLQKKMHKRYDLPRKGTKKLIPNLRDKKNYVVYGTTLRLYLELGLKLKKIHTVLAFDQSAWVRPYIEYNNRKRQKALTKFAKNLYKLYNNSFFGRSMMNMRNKHIVDLVKSRKKFRKLVRSPLFKSFEIFDNGLVAVERQKRSVYLNSPIATGQVCLDVSKEIMIRFHYQTMKAKYEKNITVLATDTDSLIYEILTDDIYEDFKEMSDKFDFCDYPKDHPLFSTVNQKVMGKFKDETNSLPIRKFVGLRAKMYAFQVQNGDGKCVGKGIPTAALRSQLEFEDYDDCLETMSLKYISYYKIATDRRHHLLTTFSTKKGLSCYEDKRYLCDNNIDTFAWGHYKIRREQNIVEEACSNSMEMDGCEDEAEGNLEELIRLMDMECI